MILPQKKDPNAAGAAADLPPPPEFDDEAAGDAETLDLPGLDLSDDAAAPASVLEGAAVIRGFLRDAPVGPGVYRMVGADGEVLYVGKARSIRRRIASYARLAGHTNRIARMIALTASMVFVSTETETEALLLETNYIKQMKPRFNVLMRDDKSFPYIFLTGDHAAPQIAKHRGARHRKGDYFGPFASVLAVNRTMNALERAFLLRSCTDSFYENRTAPVSCIRSSAARRPAPARSALRIMRGWSARRAISSPARAARCAISWRARWPRPPRRCSSSGRGGCATASPRSPPFRARRASIRRASRRPMSSPSPRRPGSSASRRFFSAPIRTGAIAPITHAPTKSLTPAEVLGAFLAQFYDDRPAPRLILLSHEIADRALLADALCMKAGHRIEIATPQRGEKRELVEHAAQNAREALSRRLAETASQEKLLKALAEAFGLEHPLRRVEVYDNSHISGTQAVGTMVVAGPAGFMKTHYRTFNIKGADLMPGDDYGMMREVLRRRFVRLAKERAAAEAAPEASAPEADAFPQRPDLILIDGGKGQFDAARQILAELDVEDVAVASIAKGCA